MATQLQVVNKVLRRLREDTVTSIADSTYAQLIAEFVNDILREVQGAHQWSALLSEVTTAVSQSTAEYDLSASINNDSDLLWAMLTTTDKEHKLTLTDFDELRRAYLYDPTQDEGEPSHFGIQNMTMRVYPIPDASYTITSKWYVPQAELEVDGTDDDTSITVPSSVVVLGAVYLAMNERGEELGEPGHIVERRYREALSEAILRDAGPRIFTNSWEAYRD